MDKDQGIVTKWANCADMPVIEHVIHELNENSRGFESMSSNASMDDVASGRSQTPRKCEMGTQTKLTNKEIDEMMVKSLVMREQFKQMKENVDMIIKKEGLSKKPVAQPQQQSNIQFKNDTPIKTYSYF